MTITSDSRTPLDFDVSDNSKQENLIQLVMVIATVLTVGTLINGLFGTIAGVTVIFALLLGQQQPISSIGLIRPERIWLLVILAFASAVLTQVIASIIVGIISSLFQLQIDTSRFDGMDGNLPMFLYWLLIGWTVAAFGEEVIWRGFLVTRTAQLFDNSQLGWTVAVLVSGLLFGMIHLWQGWLGFALTATTGMVFAIFFIKSRYRLWICILTHGIIDTIGFLGLYLGVI